MLHQPGRREHFFSKIGWEKTDYNQQQQHNNKSANQLLKETKFWRNNGESRVGFFGIHIDIEHSQNNKFLYARDAFVMLPGDSFFVYFRLQGKLVFKCSEIDTVVQIFDYKKVAFEYKKFP